jgi:PPM family protein phosphatase
MSEHPKTQQHTACSWQTVTAMHVGKRSRQEDALGVWPDAHGSTLFAVVADGAGGHGGGAEASTAAIGEAKRQWENRSKDEASTEFLRSWMAHAHEAVNQEARRKDADARTVAVALLAHGNRAAWAHAGDCRLYHIRNQEILSRTRDDSVVQVLFEQGAISEAEMGSHEDQNRLLQALGGDDAPKPRLGGAEIEPGDVLLLCSDGFWENLEPSEITQLAANRPGRWGKALEAAVQLAVQRGGHKADNTSVIMARFDEVKKGEGLARLGYLTLSLLLVAGILWLVLQSPVKEYLAPLGQAIRQKLEKLVPPRNAESTKNSTQSSSSNNPVKPSVNVRPNDQAQERTLPSPTPDTHSPPKAQAERETHDGTGTQATPALPPKP